MLKSVESQCKIKQNPVQFLDYVRHECGALATRETMRLQVDLCSISFSKLPHSIFLIPGTPWVHSLFSWWVIWERLEAPIDWDWELSPPILFVQCVFLVLLDDPKPPTTVCDMGQGWTPRGWIMHSECTKSPSDPRTQVQNSSFMAHDTRITYNPRVSLFVL